MAFDQQFRTTPLPNQQNALYTLSIRGGGGLINLVSFTFPITPQSIRKSYRALSNAFDTRGNALQLGVNRQIDAYGNTPPNYVIEGTTGWQKHAADGMDLTGLESIQQLQQLLAQYAVLSQAANAVVPFTGQTVSQLTSSAGASAGAAVTNALGVSSVFGQTISGSAIGAALGAAAVQFQLEFYDYFSDEYWVVEPMGEQVIHQSADRPLLTYYRLGWAAVKPVGNPIFGAIDELASILNIPGLSAFAGLTDTLGAGLSLYGLNGRAY